MALNRLVPGGAKLPSLTGRVVVDTYRGKLRVRSWPRKRGKKMSYLQRWYTERFAEAAQLAKYAPTTEWERATELAKNTGLYPGDLIRSAILGGSFTLEDEDGNEWTRYHQIVHPVMFQGFRLIRTSNFALTGGVGTQIPWQMVQLDTAAFWSAGAPTDITVPAGVTQMSFSFGLRGTGAFNGTAIVQIRDTAPNYYAFNSTIGNLTPQLSCHTGPLQVSEGQVFQARAFVSVGATLLADTASYFSGVVLGAS
jgi:hypothetical protein